MRERRTLALAAFVQASDNPWQERLQSALLKTEERPFSQVSWWRLSGPSGTRDVVVKTVRTNDAERQASLVVRDARDAELFHAALAGHERFRVLRPLRIYPQLGVSITPAVEAPSLGEIVERQSRWWHIGRRDQPVAETGCFLAGQWLREAQAGLSQGDAVRTADQLEQAFTVRLERLAGERSIISSHDAAAILTWVRATIREMSRDEALTTFAHGDYAPGNLLFDGQALWVLDFSVVHANTRLHDVTRFYHQLWLLTFKPGVSRATVRAWQTAFLEGYGARGLPGTPGFRLFLARHALAHLTGRAKRPSSRWWVRRYDRLISGANRRLLLDLSSGRASGL